jgi:hypothetical protein
MEDGDEIDVVIEQTGGFYHWDIWWSDVCHVWLHN